MTELICPGDRPQLQIGSDGQSVEDLQQAINARLDLLTIPTRVVPRVKIDGVFRPITQKAVRYLQCLSFIIVDGIAGTETWNAICEGSSRLPSLPLPTNLQNWCLPGRCVGTSNQTPLW